MRFHLKTIVTYKAYVLKFHQNKNKNNFEFSLEESPGLLIQMNISNKTIQSKDIHISWKLMKNIFRFSRWLSFVFHFTYRKFVREKMWYPFRWIDSVGWMSIDIYECVCLELMSCYFFDFFCSYNADETGFIYLGKG